MENAVVHYVDSIGGYGPAYLLVVGVLAVIVVLLVKFMPFWREMQNKKLDIEQEREKRKVNEAQMRNDRDMENAKIAQRQVDAQERSTMAMTAMTATIERLESRLEISQQGSSSMRDEMRDMAIEVHDIHTVVVK